MRDGENASWVGVGDVVGLGVQRSVILCSPDQTRTQPLPVRPKTGPQPTKGFRRYGALRLASAAESTNHTGKKEQSEKKLLQASIDNSPWAFARDADS